MAEWSLEQLEAFLAICRLGSFRAAADHLGITQPAVSLRIRQLEQACGTTFVNGQADVPVGGQVKVPAPRG